MKAQLRRYNNGNEDSDNNTVKVLRAKAIYFCFHHDLEDILLDRLLLGRNKNKGIPTFSKLKEK